LGDPGRALILTNDDGIDAPGLAALREAAEGLGRATVIAPSGPQSGCGHAVTTHAPFRAERRGPSSFAVEGTPADCVRLGLSQLAPEADWVLSGINAGGNLGADVFHSGTVAAAREAVLHGKPAVAISHYILKGRPIDWEVAASRARSAIEPLLNQPWVPGTFWNVNLPHPEPGAPEPRVVECPLDPSPLPLTYRVEGETFEYIGVYRDRARRPGSDVDVCFSGDVAVTLVRLFLSGGRLAGPRPETA
jgi:5'-nucleotidase